MKRQFTGILPAPSGARVRCGVCVRVCTRVCVCVCVAQAGNFTQLPMVRTFESGPEFTILTLPLLVNKLRALGGLGTAASRLALPGPGAGSLVAGPPSFALSLPLPGVL